MKLNERLQSLNMYVVLIVILYSISIQNVLEKYFESYLINYTINFLSSIGFYRFLLVTIYKIIDRSNFFLKLYWGKFYFKGFWSYTYTLDGKVYTGLWRIDQNLFGIEVIGYGLDGYGKPRSDVRSISNLIERANSYEIINMRRDKIDITRENYSKTILYPDFNPKGHLFRIAYPIKMRATTHIFGGQLNGKVHEDVFFIKHENALCEEDVIKFISKDIKA